MFRLEEDKCFVRCPEGLDIFIELINKHENGDRTYLIRLGSYKEPEPINLSINDKIELDEKLG